MNTTKEIEVKLKFKDRQSIINSLGDQVSFDKKVTIKDKYYSQKYKDMSNAHDLVRVRQTDEIAELTFKGSATDKNQVWQRTELNVEISSAEKMGQILTSLGFRAISENESEREIYKYSDLEIIFIKFTKPASLEFMEIEGTSQESIDQLINKLGDQVERIGEEAFKKFDEKRKQS